MGSVERRKSRPPLTLSLCPRRGKELKQFRIRKRANRSCAFDFIRSIRTAKQLLSSWSKFALDLEKLIASGSLAQKAPGDLHIWKTGTRAGCRSDAHEHESRGAVDRDAGLAHALDGRRRDGRSRLARVAVPRARYFKRAAPAEARASKPPPPRLARDARGARRERVRRAVARDPDADDGRFRRRGARRDRDRASDVARRLRGKKAPPDVV